jgi:hypothetical protein
VRALLCIEAPCEAPLTPARNACVLTVASFLGLHPPRQLALPVMLNVVMIGFSGESGLNVSEAQLRPWFEQLQSKLPHAVMPAEAAASARRLRPPPVPSAIEYRYHTRLHVLPPEVTSQVEALIAAFIRPEQLSSASTSTSTSTSTSAGEASALQMSTPRMSALLASLLEALQLPGFSLVVLNPSRRSEHKYGCAAAPRRARAAPRRLYTMHTPRTRHAHATHTPRTRHARLLCTARACGPRSYTYYGRAYYGRAYYGRAYYGRAY